MVSVGQIDQYSISNEFLQVSAINFGARTTQVLMNAGSRGWLPMIQSLPEVKSYLNDRHNMGALVGPLAGRVRNGQYHDGRKWIKLAKNAGNHHLHGGHSGFAQVLWRVSHRSDAIEFSHVSKDGDNGYPGNLEVTSTITLCGRDLIYRTTAICDKLTPFNPTQHNYYNLGAVPTIYAHKLSIEADKILELDSQRLPTGRTIAVEGSDFDFRKRKSLTVIQTQKHPQIESFNGLDHYYVLNHHNDSNTNQQAVAELCTRAYRMQVFTNQPGLQVYTGNALSPAHQGICIEAQHFPDSPNHSHFPSVFLEPGHTGLNETRYRFLEAV